MRGGNVKIYVANSTDTTHTNARRRIRRFDKVRDLFFSRSSLFFCFIALVIAGNLFWNKKNLM